MAVVTVVRSRVGQSIRLPDLAKPIRPWHFVELTSLTSTQCDVLRELLEKREVQVSQLVDGAPVSYVRLSPSEK